MPEFIKKSGQQEQHLGLLGCLGVIFLLFIFTPVHIEEFTRARVNESDLTEVLVETCAMPIPTKSQNH